jgi:hypothetical protein
MQSKQKFVVTVNDLYKIYVDGFNRGTNNEADEHGLFTLFESIFDDNPPLGGAGIKFKLKEQQPSILIEDLEMFMKCNQDNFDRGRGIALLNNFIENNENK